MDEVWHSHDTGNITRVETEEDSTEGRESTHLRGSARWDVAVALNQQQLELTRYAFRVTGASMRETSLAVARPPPAIALYWWVCFSAGSRYELLFGGRAKNCRSNTNNDVGVDRFEGEVEVEVEVLLFWSCGVVE